LCKSQAPSDVWLCNHRRTSRLLTLKRFRARWNKFLAVLPALVACIHIFLRCLQQKSTWIAAKRARPPWQVTGSIWSGRDVCERAQSMSIAVPVIILVLFSAQFYRIWPNDGSEQKDKSEQTDKGSSEEKSQADQSSAKKNGAGKVDKSSKGDESSVVSKGARQPRTKSNE
jgi:hypothetical protein